MSVLIIVYSSSLYHQIQCAHIVLGAQENKFLKKCGKNEQLMSFIDRENIYLVELSH